MDWMRSQWERFSTKPDVWGPRSLSMDARRSASESQLSDLKIQHDPHRTGRNDMTMETCDSDLPDGRQGPYKSFRIEQDTAFCGLSCGLENITFQPEEFPSS